MLSLHLREFRDVREIRGADTFFRIGVWVVTAVLMLQYLLHVVSAGPVDVSVPGGVPETKRG